MKLKNSYILLIVMAIFLLISIGSVCANENITTDEVSLADDGTDVVLADGSATQKIDTKIDSKNVKIKEKQTQQIDVTVKDKESEPINVSKENLTVTKDNKKLNFTYANNSITLTDSLSKGNHSLLISYLGNDVYKNSTKNIILSIFGNYAIDASSTINVNQTQKVEVPIKLTNGVDETKELSKDNFTVKITGKDGNETKTINTSNLNYNAGKLTFNADLLDNVTSYTMTVTYNNNGTKLSKSITLKKVRSIKIKPIISENYYQDGNFTFEVRDAITNEVITNESITISGKYNETQIYWDIKQSGGSISLSTSKGLKTDDKGIATLKNANFYPNLILTNSDIYAPVGEYILTFSGTNMVCDDEVSIAIKKVKTKITVDKFSEYYGTTKKVKIVVTNSETGKPIRGATVFFNMTDSNRKEIEYSSKNSNNTTVKINYITTDSNGAIELPVSNLVTGKYSVYALLDSTSNNDKSTTTKTITIKAKPVTYTISSTGIITVKDKSTGKKIAGAVVSVKFDNNKNKMFLAQTSSAGTVKITTVGKHKISVSDAETRYTGKTVTKTITNKKITAKASAPKVTTYYKGDKPFTVTLTTSDKKPIYDAKLNIRLYISSNKYTSYQGTTYIDGQIRLSLESLSPGTYKVEITSGDTKSFSLKKVTSKIVIKKAPTKLTPTKLTAKKGASKYFKVTVKNTKTKKVISGVKVKIKVYTGKKYKTYTVKTNSKGIAKINVKSLKVGTHKVVVTSADKYCTAKTAKSTIKITKK